MDDKPQQSGPSISGDINVTNSPISGRDIRIGHTIHTTPPARTLEGINVAAEVHRLRAYRGTAISMGFLMGDPEKLELASQIHQLLTLAEWAPGEIASVIDSATPIGVAIYHKGPQLSAALQELRDCLHGLGLHVTDAANPEISTPSLIVGVNVAGSGR